MSNLVEYTRDVMHGGWTRDWSLSVRCVKFCKWKVLQRPLNT